MTGHRFIKRTAPKPTQAGAPHACAALDALPLPFSPLVTELIAMHAHTRQLVWLARRETCQDQTCRDETCRGREETRREEFRMAAGSLLSDLLQAWQHQTGGRGSLEDLLADLPAALPAGASIPQCPEKARQTGARHTQ